MKEEIPVVAAEREKDGRLSIWCTFCKMKHFHGNIEGHRLAHCMNEKSPYLKTGYIIREKN